MATIRIISYQNSKSFCFYMAILDTQITSWEKHSGAKLHACLPNSKNIEAGILKQNQKSLAWGVKTFVINGDTVND